VPKFDVKFAKCQWKAAPTSSFPLASRKPSSQPTKVLWLGFEL